MGSDAYIGTSGEGGSIYRSQLNILQDEYTAPDPTDPTKTVQAVWSNGVETTTNDPALGTLPCLKYLPDAGRVKLNAGCPQVTPPQTLTSGLERNQFSFNGHYDFTPDFKFVTERAFSPNARRSNGCVPSHCSAIRSLRPIPITVSVYLPLYGSKKLARFH